MEVLLAWKILVWITPQPFLLQQASQKVTLKKILKTGPFAILTLRLLVCQMIVRLFRFQLLILLVWDCLISMLIGMVALILGQQKFASITKSSGKLFCHGKLVDAVEVNVGLNRFGLWLKELCGRVVLVGHNVRAFDVKRFWNNVKNGIWRICLALALKVLLIHSHYLEIFFQKNSHS